RTRLLTTTQDLGQIGYDNLYGFGLLDTYNMLTSTIVPEINISYPADNSGFSSSFDIYGTVKVAPSEDFFRYSVTYTTEDMPGSADWLNVDPTENIYHYEQVEDGYLATFILDELMPDDVYKIKLEVVTSDQQHYSAIRTVHIDQTPPEFKQEYSTLMERYNNEFNNYYIGAVFDEPISLEVIDTEYNTSYFSNYADSTQIINIPYKGIKQSILNLKATNLAGLSTEIAAAFSFENLNKTIDTNSFEQTALAKQLIPIRQTYDFDGNGIEEVLAMEVQADSSRILKAFEFDGDIVQQKKIFPFGSFFWPYDIGNLDFSEVHILGVEANSAQVYEAPAGSSYPSNLVLTVNDCYGGSFIDING
ncbi:MAG: hypothetical protein KAS49_03560, partial [Candidatus Cloacimonetes bacterium]|nr:hypothetical protein [Candidatus Cloacimonadota bacterium]